MSHLVIFSHRIANKISMCMNVYELYPLKVEMEDLFFKIKKTS